MPPSEGRTSAIRPPIHRVGSPIRPLMHSNFVATESQNRQTIALWHAAIPGYYGIFPRSIASATSSLPTLAVITGPTEPAKVLQQIGKNGKDLPIQASYSPQMSDRWHYARGRSHLRRQIEKLI
jgi:hypothetical protein